MPLPTSTSGPEVGIVTGDRRRGVDHARDVRRDQRVGGGPVQVHDVDDDDVPGSIRRRSASMSCSTRAVPTTPGRVLLFRVRRDAIRMAPILSVNRQLSREARRNTGPISHIASHLQQDRHRPLRGGFVRLGISRGPPTWGAMRNSDDHFIELARRSRTLCFAQYGGILEGFVVVQRRARHQRADVTSPPPMPPPRRQRAVDLAGPARLLAVPTRVGADPAGLGRRWSQLLDRLGVARCAAMGWSMGGRCRRLGAALRPRPSHGWRSSPGRCHSPKSGCSRQLPGMPRVLTRPSQRMPVIARLCFSRRWGLTARVPWNCTVDSAPETWVRRRRVLYEDGLAAFGAMSARALRQPRVAEVSPPGRGQGFTRGRHDSGGGRLFRRRRRNDHRWRPAGLTVSPPLRCRSARHRHLVARRCCPESSSGCGADRRRRSVSPVSGIAVGARRLSAVRGHALGRCRTRPAGRHAGPAQRPVRRRRAGARHWPHPAQAHRPSDGVARRRRPEAGASPRSPWCVRASRASPPPDLDRGTAADAGVDLVEHHRVPADEAASTTSSASITRDSSPRTHLAAAEPRAARCAVKPNSTTSTPYEPARARPRPSASTSGGVSGWAVVAPTVMVKSAPDIARPASSAVTALASAAALVRALVRSAAAAASLTPSSSTSRCSPLSASSDTSSRASRALDSAAQASTPSTSAAYLRVSERNSAWRASFNLECRCVTWQFGQIGADLAGDVADDGGGLPSWAPRPCSSTSSVPCRDASARPIDAVAAHRRGSSASPARARRAARRPRRAGRRVRTAAGCRRPVVRPPRFGVDGVDLLDREGEPIGLLASSTRPLGAVGQVASGPAPFVAQLLVALRRALTSANRSSAARCSSGRISRSWSFCRAAPAGAR